VCVVSVSCVVCAAYQATYLPWDRREDCFVSYTELEGEVSLIGDSASLRQYSFPVEGSREPWAIIKVDEGPLGFEEAGIGTTTHKALPRHDDTAVNYVCCVWCVVCSGFAGGAARPGRAAALLPVDIPYGLCFRA
jgi:hypothetical protein